MSRSKYSHGGCIICKKRGIKCDELAPACTNCQRKGVECEYRQRVFVYQPNQPSKRKKKFKPIVLTKTAPKPPSADVSDEIIEESIEKLWASFNKSQEEKDGDETSLQCRDLDKLSANTATEQPSYLKHWTPYSRDRYLELSSKLDAVGAKTRNVHYHEYHPEVQEHIWHFFTHSKQVFNFVLIPSDENNCVSSWCATFAPIYPIIPLTVNAITSNLLNLKCADDRWDCLHQRTMRVALTNISKRVNECDTFPEMACYLLCILFLVSERSATRGTAWRLHLQAAFAILERCDILYSTVSKSSGDLDPIMKDAMHLYSFAKNWFVSFETVACLSAPNGGAITDIACCRNLLSYDGFRQGDGYLIGGFNLMKCFSQSLTPVFADIIVYIASFKQAEGISLSGYEGVLQNLPYSEERTAMGRRLLQDIQRVEQQQFGFLDIKDVQLRAYMRACNICFCCALRIYIHSVFLGKSIYGQEVQHSVQVIEEQLLSAPNIQTYGLCIHWPLFIAALCAPPGDQRTNFITVLKLISNNGTYVARNTVERVERCWKNIDSDGLVDEKDYDSVTM